MSAVPTHVPGPACSSPPALLAPGSQAGPLALSFAPASFLAAPGSTPAGYNAGSRAPCSWVASYMLLNWPEEPWEGDAAWILLPLSHAVWWAQPC